MRGAPRASAALPASATPAALPAPPTPSPLPGAPTPTQPAQGPVALGDGGWLVERAADWLAPRVGRALASQPSAWSLSQDGAARTELVSVSPGGFANEIPTLDLRFTWTEAGCQVHAGAATAICEDDDAARLAPFVALAGLADPTRWGREAWAIEALTHDGTETTLRLAIPRLRLRFSVVVAADGRVVRLDNAAGTAALEPVEGGFELRVGKRWAATLRPDAGATEPGRAEGLALHVDLAGADLETAGAKVDQALARRRLQPVGPTVLEFEAAAGAIRWRSAWVPVLAVADPVGPGAEVRPLRLAPVTAKASLLQADLVRELAATAVAPGCLHAQLLGRDPAAGETRFVVALRPCTP